MECKQVEDLISSYIENELPEDLFKEISDHLNHCDSCARLHEKVEDLMVFLPELNEEVPFFLKNRLYYIPESEIDIHGNGFAYLRWVAALIGTFVLFLNLFYFTNIYPTANKALHTIVSDIEKIAVKTEALIEKLTESKNLFISREKTFAQNKEDIIKDQDTKQYQKLKGGSNG